MAIPAITFEQLLDWRDEETKKWRAFFDHNPSALDLPCTIAGTSDVRGLVLHICAVELRYAQRLHGFDVTPYEALDSTSIASLFGTGERASSMLHDYISRTNDAQLATVMEFPTRSAGTLKASKRKILIHAVLHGMRHWAQLASLLRDQGLQTDWPHDYLMTQTMP